MEYILPGLITIVVVIAFIKRMKGKKSSSRTNYTPASDIFSGSINSYRTEHTPSETTREHPVEQVESGVYDTEDYVEPINDKPFNDVIDHMSKIEGNPYGKDTNLHQLPKGIRFLLYGFVGFVILIVIGIIYGTWFY